MAVAQNGYTALPEETTPLLLQAAEAQTAVTTKHELVYQRFSTRWKRIIVAIVSFMGLIPFILSGTFIPSIPQISKDLGSTGVVISWAVSLSIFGASFGALSASSYSTFYGRRPVYLSLMPFLIVGSFGVAGSQTVPTMMFWRVLQAFGASPGWSVGAGVIGDLYKLEERGGAMGIFFSAILLGPTLAPLIGGLAAHYSSWRSLQAMIGFMGVATFLLLYFFLPETSHPGQTGIEKRKSQVKEWTHPSWRPIFLNPLRPLALMKSPNLFFVSMASLFILLTDYVLLVPIAYTFGKRYDITNEAVIGACFLPAGLGNMIGAPLAGRISDHVVIRWKAKRGGVWYPEDRLRATLLGALLFVPLSIAGSGVVTAYVEDRTLGLSLNFLCLFVNGLGVDIVLSPTASYIVDIMHSRSAECMAANSATRSVLLAVFVAGILPMVETYGVVTTDLLSGGLALFFGFGLLWITIRFGEQLRSWGNVGYSTDGNN